MGSLAVTKGSYTVETRGCQSPAGSVGCRTGMPSGREGHPRPELRYSWGLRARVDADGAGPGVVSQEGDQDAARAARAVHLDIHDAHPDELAGEHAGAVPLDRAAAHAAQASAPG